MPPPAKSQSPNQLSLPGFAKKKRRGARPVGRPVGTGRRRVRHRLREAHAAPHPVHVVLRSKFKPLRSQFVFPTIRAALAAATRRRADFRVAHFSVQGDHLHLLVEAETQSALSRGMQGLAIRVARAVNKLVGRSGKVWADRFFSRELSSPRAVRNALAYVLNNFRKHRVTAASLIDPYSSAPYFAGFAELRGRAPHQLPHSRALPLVPRGVPSPQAPNGVPILPARTWLGRTGWQRAGLIRFRDVCRTP